MALKNPKNKGNSHERKVAKLLSEWSGYEFHRTPQSGALHWDNDKRVVSDIVAPQNINWPFSVECKNTETSWELNTIIEGTSVTFRDHWNQCYQDSQREELRPMLVFTKNYRDIYMAIEKKDFEKLDIHPQTYLESISPDFNIIIMKFTEFLSLVTLDKVVETLK